MKLTCLSKGDGFHFPPCHILIICGFRILLECPVDLSALTIFSPVPSDFHTVLDEENSDHAAQDSLNAETVCWKRQKAEKPLEAKNLIYAEPWYKTVKNLHLWNVSFIDIVVISSPMGMLGLPFLTRVTGFSAKIYVTEATARLGQLMMEDLVSMHMEFRQFYGFEESGFPQWMDRKELELLPSALREIVFGKDGEELGSWMPLYSAADVEDCMGKVQTLRFGEEACYNGTLTMKAFSSGLEIGACNWTINGPRRNFLSMERENVHSSTPLTTDSSNLGDGNSNSEEFIKSLLNIDESLEEMEKLAFVCSCAVDSVKGGGSVLISINRIGLVLQLLEQMSIFLESSTLKVPIYIISSIGEELLSFTNIIPEWLCEHRQQKLFSGEPLFAHVELIKEGKIHLHPAVHSPILLSNWQEPCIVFAPHWTLRLGPVVHLLRRWCGDQRSLLVLESGVDADMALLPFKPVAMKILQCSFLSGIKSQKIQPLLKILQPKLVVLPEYLRQEVTCSSTILFSVFHFSDKETLRIPSLKDSSEVEIATKASQLKWRKLKKKGMKITRLEGELLMNQSRYLLFPAKMTTSSKQRTSLLHMGSPNLERLLTMLSNMNVSGSLEQRMGESDNVGVIHVHDPYKALIEVGATSTVITSADEKLAGLIFKAIDSIMEGI
ncbi:Beta-Casp domain-containing protein [Cephalotus follicularis]|uniref:Beta-Casp domain-containing protein n=1 Tax=Cephalotus follicularis TaxID=3775 RepID=A0A1Q3CFK5_CEPFO|nr:Beta-Casp domain-containing protein [Cephalotus follicularis]